MSAEQPSQAPPDRPTAGTYTADLLAVVRANVEVLKAHAGIRFDAELARRSGLPNATISRLLSGDQQTSVRFETLARLAWALRVPVSDLLTPGGADAYAREAARVMERIPAGQRELAVRLLKTVADRPPAPGKPSS